MDTTQPYGLVHGRINLGVGDDVDAGRAPNLVGLNGKASFAATVDKFLVTTPGAEMIIVPSAIVADIVNGALQWLGADDVPLVANLDATGKSLGWQWAVSFTLTNSAAQPVTLVGWRLDVGVYDANAAFVNGQNPTITQLTAQAPVVSNSVATLAKGDPGGVVDLVQGTNTTTTDIAAVGGFVVDGATPLQKKINFVGFVGAGGGGGSGTVVKVNGVFPDGSGAVTLSPVDIGAAAQVDLTTAQQTASNALTTANSAQSAATAAQTTATNAQNGLSSKADISALAPLAPLASPTFTGDPKAPTPATADNDTSIATTAFVRSAITAYAPAAGSSSSSPVAELVWDVPTQKWVNGAGTAVTARPAAKLVVLYGTTDANAVKPSWLAIGDVGIWHPDSAYNI